MKKRYFNQGFSELEPLWLVTSAGDACVLLLTVYLAFALKGTLALSAPAPMTAPIGHAVPRLRERSLPSC
jgi:hypothetical protein